MEARWSRKLVGLGVAGLGTFLLFVLVSARASEIDFQSLKPLKTQSLTGPSKKWTISLQGAQLQWRRFENRKTRQSREITLVNEAGTVLSFGERRQKMARSDHELLEGMRKTNAQVPHLHYLKTIGLRNAVGKKMLVYKNDSPLLDQNPYYYFAYFRSPTVLVTMVASPQPGARGPDATAKDIAAVAKTLKFKK
jgi:hypothetical protein